MIPDDRSQYDVHGALEDDKVKQLEYIWCIFVTYDAHDSWYFVYYSNYIYYVSYYYYIYYMLLILGSLHVYTPFMLNSAMYSWPSDQVRL